MLIPFSSLNHLEPRFRKICTPNYIIFVLSAHRYKHACGDSVVHKTKAIKNRFPITVAPSHVN